MIAKLLSRFCKGKKLKNYSFCVTTYQGGEIIERVCYNRVLSRKEVEELVEYMARIHKVGKSKVQIISMKSRKRYIKQYRTNKPKGE